MKKPSRAHCTHCEHEFEPNLHRGWTIAAGATGLVVGGLVTENFFGGILIGGLCYATARFADRHYALRCPSCGEQASWIEEEAPERPEGVREEARPAA